MPSWRMSTSSTAEPTEMDVLYGGKISNEEATESSKIRSGASAPGGTWIFQSHDGRRTVNSEMYLEEYRSKSAAVIREKPGIFKHVPQSMSRQC
ncbi:hypothetical protein TNCV_4528541 [Trichonephila clavipes]|nr:hypothetical protein TNCV_4528541 [Trichonephila clavipes]